MAVPLLIRAEMLSQNTGYGQVVINAARALTAGGVDVMILSHRDDETKDDLPEDIINLIGFRDTPLKLSDMPILQIATPGLQIIEGSNTVAWTFWEVNTLHPLMVRNLDRAKGLIVSSPWNREIFADQMPNIPIKVVPLGVDLNVFHPSKRTEYIKTRFGTSGRQAKGGVRKGVKAVIEGFNIHAKNYPNSLLSVKMPADEPIIDIETSPGVVVEHSNRTQSEMADWYANLDMYVSGSCGEAFGLQLLEAMACGTPVATISATGESSFWNYRCGCPLGWNRNLARGCVYAGFGASWYEPTPKHIAQAMDWAVEHSAPKHHTPLRQYGLNARHEAEKFGLDRMHELLCATVHGYFPECF